MKNCKNCNLYKNCTNSFVSGRAGRPNRIDIMIVQDAPTFLEDRYGDVLVGEIKEKLNYFLAKADIDYRRVYFTNAVKCRPKNLSDIKNKHIEACSPYLYEEIEKYRPTVIIASGKYAFKMLSNYESIREFRGHFQNFKLEIESDAFGKEVTTEFKCKVMPTFSINASVMKWEYNEDIIRDFIKARKYADTGEINKTRKPKVNTILTKKGINEFVERYREAKYCTTDFETTGLDFWKHEIINAGYCDKVGRADVLFLNPYKQEHLEYKKWNKEDVERALQINDFLKHHREDVLQALKTVNGFKHLKKILHNGKFDIKFSWKYKIPYVNFWFDTLMADSLIDENLGHSLNIALERRGIDFGAYDTKLWPYINKDEKKKKSYQFVPPRLLEKYLGMDVDGDMRLFKIQYRELKKEGLLEHLIKRKMVTIRNVAKMEYIGFKADRKLIEKASNEIEELQKNIQKKLEKATGIKGFNANSPSQICNYMYDNNYPIKKLKIAQTKSGFSTSSKELDKFIEYGNGFDVVPKLIKEFKKYSKIKGTYVDGTKNNEANDFLEGGMLQYLDKNDRIHTSYNLHSPRTGRESASRPSVQVWPRPIKGLTNPRNFVIPTSKKWNFFEADYSALEIHVVAVLSKDKILTKRLQLGMDLHCINANDLGHILKTVPDWVTYEHLLLANEKESKISDKSIIPELKRDLEKWGKDIDWHEKRTQAKNLGFGINYGKEASTFAKEFGISVEDAERMIDGYFDLYKDVKSWRDKTVWQALNKGYITLLSGRKRRFFGVVDWINSDYGIDSWSSERLRSEISRQAMNFPVQGGGQEVFEPALIRVEKAFKRNGLKARIFFRIHDGILGECPIEENEMVKHILETEMPEIFNKGTKYELKLNVDIDFYEWEWYGPKKNV